MDSGGSVGAMKAMGADSLGLSDACLMQPLVIVVGGKNANIRKQDGQSIRATMSRFVDRVIVGGNKGGAFGK